MPEKKPGPCPADKVSRAWWCPKCGEERADKDLKSGACATCETKAVRIEYCVRTDAATKAQDKARIHYACAACGAASEIEAEFKHDEDCRRKTAALRKVCSKSGAAPHQSPPK
jgi:hypothetical protein